MEKGEWIPQCGKYGYRSEFLAKAALADAQRMSYLWEKPPTAFYRCVSLSGPSCGQLHLTSKSSGFAGRKGFRS